MLLQPMNDPRQADVPAVHPVSWVMGARRENPGLKCADPYEPDVDADLRAKEREPREHPDADYMSKMQQGHLSPSMRAELVLWMDAFARHLGGLPEGTLCRAVAYLDRVLSVRPVPAHDEALQLVAAAAVSLGAKHEQSSSGRRLDAQVVEAFLGTTVHVVEEMEWELFMDLGCAMDGPTAYTFIDHFTRFFQREDEFLVRSLALRLVNLTLPFFGFVGRILPSAVAASALFLAKQIVGVPLSHDLEEVTGYKAMELMDCICALEKLLPRKNL
ncbi:putative cyclin-F1-1 [Triticum dicoccoides]|uniref:putative cyclin-F1-1 n=1 Tax=Triticum dicoccoides TaxID=85692 RepID=UPI00188F0BC2|nr:putative cyclin-F1-1 [Triticum dicoccoides]